MIQICSKWVQYYAEGSTSFEPEDVILAVMIPSRKKRFELKTCGEKIKTICGIGLNYILK